jgi:radical SAM protein with 4Fe4S-binding SPASM domain
MHSAGSPDVRELLATPLHVAWVITSRCNLACSYCLEDAVPAYTEDVPQELRDRIAREIIDSRVLKVSISGGEPLLVNSLPRLVAELRDGGVFVRVTTNGVLLDDDLADRLAKARLSVAEVSLHPGHEDKGLSAVSSFNTRGVRTIVRVVVSSENHLRLAELIEPLRSSGVERVILQEVTPIGRAAGAGHGSLLDLDKTLAVRERVAEIRSAWGDDRVRFSSGTLADEEAGHPVLCSIGTRVRKSCEVRPRGNVIPCAPATVFGVRNMIEEKGLAACWRDIPRLYARFASEEPDGKCPRCDHSQACHGGCRAVSRLVERHGRREECAHFGPAAMTKGPERLTPAPSPRANS